MINLDSVLRKQSDAMQDVCGLALSLYSAFPFANRQFGLMVFAKSLFFFTLVTLMLCVESVSLMSVDCCLEL